MTRSQARSPRRWLGTSLLQLVMLVGSALVLLPLITMLLSSLKSNSDIYADPWSIPWGQLQWGNYLEALQGPTPSQSLAVYYGNTIIVAAISLFLVTLLGAIAGFALAKSSSRWVAVLDRYFVVLLTIPIFVTVTPLFSLMGFLGLRNNLFGLAIVYTATMLPPTIILCRSYFSAFPVEVLEAAQIDGLGSFGTIFRLVLPISLPSLVGIFMMNLLWVWGELLFALALQTRPEMKTLPVGLLSFKGQYVTDLGVQFAGLVLATVPLFIVYAIFSRKITDSMAAGVAK